MTVIVEDSRGWFYNGFHKQGSEVEVSKAVYEAVKDSVKLKVKESVKSKS